MSVTIFFEGGGDKEATQSKCRKGLSEYCAKIKPKDGRLKIVAGGGRQQTFDKFKIAVSSSRSGEVSVLLVDAEGPVTAATPVEHLREKDGWNLSGLASHQAFLMVQAMEAWFLADREALASFYRSGFLVKSLPGSPANIETIRKEDLEPSLKHASKQTQKKEYQKLDHGTALLALIDPVKVGEASPHAKRFNDFLRSL